MEEALELADLASDKDEAESKSPEPYTPPKAPQFPTYHKAESMEVVKERYEDFLALLAIKINTINSALATQLLKDSGKEMDKEDYTECIQSLVTSGGHEDVMEAYLEQKWGGLEMLQKGLERATAWHNEEEAHFIKDRMVHDAKSLGFRMV